MRVGCLRAHGSTFMAMGGAAQVWAHAEPLSRIGSRFNFILVGNFVFVSLRAVVRASLGPQSSEHGLVNGVSRMSM